MKRSYKVDAARAEREKKIREQILKVLSEKTLSEDDILNHCGTMWKGMVIDTISKLEKEKLIIRIYEVGNVIWGDGLAVRHRPLYKVPTIMDLAKVALRNRRENYVTRSC